MAASVATMPSKEMKPAEAAAALTVAKTAPQETETVSATGMAGIELHPEWPLLSRIPMRLTPSVPLPHFRVRDLLGLKPGQLLESAWQTTDDVPLKIGSVQLSWSEFEVVEQRMAIRLTRLA